jgi:putative ABC transport system permease protein
MRRDEPPRLATRLLHARLPRELFEAIAGDLEEAYLEQLTTRGPGRAALYYWREVLGFVLSRHDYARCDVARHRVTAATNGEDMMRMTAVEALVRDLGLAWRRLIRTPGFTAIAITSLALGIGVNTLMFSFVNAGLLRPLPFPEPDRLVSISMAPPNNPGQSGVPLPPPLFFLLRDQSRLFDAVGAYDPPRSVNLAGDASGFAAERLLGHRISAGALTALGLKPLLGRYHEAREDLSSAERTIVLSHALWQRRFGGRPDIVGQTALIDGRSTSIIGVTPAAFDLFDGSSDAWLAFGFEPAAAQGSAHWLRCVGRLKPGVSLDQAAAEVQGLRDEWERAFPDRGKGWTMVLQPMDEALFGNMRQPLTLMQTAVGLVLLISCANLAALILTRAVGRQRELAVRSALGQSRGSLVRQLMMESVLLSLGAGIVGAFMTWMSLRPLVALTPEWFPRLGAVTLDVTVFAFCFAICLVASVLFGLIPAVQVSRTNSAQALQEGGARTSGGRSRMLQLQGLVVVQVMLAFVLLIGAGLVIKTLIRLQNVGFGVDTSNLLSVQVQVARGQYMKENVAVAPGVTLVDYSPAAPLLFDRIHEALQTVPGVVRTAGSVIPPLTGSFGVQFRVEGAPPNTKPSFTPYQFVTAGFFDTMKIRIVRGRDFGAGDQVGSPWVLVVNEAAAREYWPGDDPIGKRLTFVFYNNDGERPREVVGVVADTPQFRGESRVGPLVYALHRQQLVRQRASLELQRTTMSYVLRTSGDPMALAATVRAAVARIDPAVPVVQMRTVDSYLSAQLQDRRFIATLFGIFAAVALGIGVIGIYGVTSHLVSIRYREFGIRRALGAGTGNVLGLVIRRGAVILSIGVVLGVGAALVLTRFLERFLWGVTRSDLATFVTIAAVLVATGLIACLVPGSRAARVDPLVALKHE